MVGLRNLFARRGVMPSSTGLVVHALHKSASMFLHKFFHDLCERLDCPYFSIHNVPANESNIPDSINHSFVLCPVRSFNCDSYVYPQLKHVRYLLQVRDPRDILVSEYFSLGWRHTSKNWSDEALRRREKIQNMSIDEFVLEEPHGKPPLLERYRPVMDLGKRDNVCLVRYETLVTQFPIWLETVLDLLELGNEKRLKQKLLLQYRGEFQPDLNEQGHKRNILPGDHRKKLAPETIAKLNKRFQPLLQQLNYELS